MEHEETEEVFLPVFSRTTDHYLLLLVAVAFSSGGDLLLWQLGALHHDDLWHELCQQTGSVQAEDPPAGGRKTTQ